MNRADRDEHGKQCERGHLPDPHRPNGEFCAGILRASKMATFCARVNGDFLRTSKW
jgi:hypothetical protein